MSLLFIDTETTGVPKKFWKNWDECYAVQISYVITDKEFNQLDAKDYIIKDSLHKSSEESLSIHKITEEQRNAKGILINRFFILFKQDIEQYNVKHIIAHGILFDVGLLLHEAIRIGRDLDFFANMDYYCTKKSPLYVKQKGLSGTIAKYNLKVNSNGNPHNALYDAYLCMSLFSYTREKKNLKITFHDIVSTVFNDVNETKIIA